MLKPNFFIVGAPKSGTTALYDYLKQHPQVYMPHRKEIPFFCPDLHYTTPPVSESIYLNYYKEAAHQKAIGDAFPLNLLSKQAAHKINQFNPGAKIIIMLRNPVQMVYSAHSQVVFNGDEPLVNFKEALDAESARKAGKLIPAHRRCPVEAYFYSSFANYYEQVLRYTSVFAKDKIHIILYDDFKADTETEYVKVLEFLELDVLMPRSFKVINASNGIRSKAYLQFLMNPGNAMKAAGRFIFPHHTKRREWIIDKLWALNAKNKPREPLSVELKQRLLDMYKDDIEKLAGLLNRDLSAWLTINNA